MRNTHLLNSSNSSGYMRNFVLLTILSLVLHSCKPADNYENASIDKIDNRIAELKDEISQLKSLRKNKIIESGQSYVPEDEILSTSISDSTALVKGKIETILGGKFALELDRPYSSDKIFRAKIDSDGKFEIEIPLEKATIFDFTYADQKGKVYLSPSKTVGILIDTSQSTPFQFVGDLTFENEILINETFHNNIKSKHFESFEEYKIIRDELMQKSINYADSIYSLQNDHPIEHDFVHLLVNNHVFSSLYPIIHDIQHLSDTIDAQNIYDTNFFEGPVGKLNDDKLFTLYAYRKFAFEYFESFSSAMITDTSMMHHEYFIKKYELIDSFIENDKLREFLKTDVAYEAISKTKSTDINPIIRKFREENSSKEFEATVSAHYKKHIYATAGALAPDIKGKSYDGEPFRLSHHRGKYVYIFVWATWCGPCKTELPSYERLLEEFGEANIDFIGISVDKDESKWLESFLFQKYPGKQVLVKGNWNSPIIKDFNLKAVPQFILIDPDGEIISTDAPKPTKGASSYLKSFGV